VASPCPSGSQQALAIAHYALIRPRSRAEPEERLAERSVRASTTSWRAWPCRYRLRRTPVPEVSGSGTRHRTSISSSCRRVAPRQRVCDTGSLLPGARGASRWAADRRGSARRLARRSRGGRVVWHGWLGPIPICEAPTEVTLPDRDSVAAVLELPFGDPRDTSAMYRATTRPPRGQQLLGYAHLCWPSRWLSHDVLAALRAATSSWSIGRPQWSRWSGSFDPSRRALARREQGLACTCCHAGSRRRPVLGSRSLTVRQSARAGPSSGRPPGPVELRPRSAPACRAFPPG
jgi:hypothetical protein